MIQFRFNAKKAAQAAHQLLRLSGGQRNYLELIKLLYLADREALLQLDRPITGDRFAAFQYGPVLGHILELIKWGPDHEEDAPWFDAVSAPYGYEVKSLAESGDDELSGAEMQILTDIFTQHGKLNWKDLSRLTRQLPEWIDPKGGELPIAPETILLLAGRTDDEVNALRTELAIYENLDAELSTYRPRKFEAPAERAVA